MDKRSERNRMAWMGVLWLLGHLVPAFVSAQEVPAGGEFINQGLLSISREYTLAKDASSIIFKIRNNSIRTITHIFGWVYKYRETENGRKTDFILVNNPHTGGGMVKEKLHRPGTVVEWRFHLTGGSPPKDSQIKYTLRVHPQSIFFTRVEPRKESGADLSKSGGKGKRGSRRSN